MPGSSIDGVVPHVSPGAAVDSRANLGPGTTVRADAEICEYAQLGAGSTVGRGAHIGVGVIVGKYCTVHDYAYLYEPALVEEEVSIGPGAVLTNGSNPRALGPDGMPRPEATWNSLGVTVRRGASIGARSVCIAPITIGQWAMIEPGSIVIENVPDYALMSGDPARRIGWVGRAGAVLQERGDGFHVCPVTGDLYRQTGCSMAPVESRSEAAS
jgi:acetyltransferase-like isoleucine patch superfamily enzyme